MIDAGNLQERLADEMKRCDDLIKANNRAFFKMARNSEDLELEETFMESTNALVRSRQKIASLNWAIERSRLEMGSDRAEGIGEYRAGYVHHV